MVQAVQSSENLEAPDVEGERLVYRFGLSIRRWHRLWVVVYGHRCERG